MKRKPLSIAEALKPYAPVAGAFVRNRLALATGIASLLIVDGLQLVIPLVIKRAIDALTLRSATSGLLLSYAAWIMAMAAVMAVLRYVWRFFLLGHARMIERDLRARMFSRLQELSPAFYGQTPTGDLMARMTNDLNAVRMATGMGLAALTDGILMGAAAIAFMVYLDPGLALVTLIPAPCIVVLSRVYTRRMSRSYERLQARFGTLTERVREAFAGVRVIKSFGRENWASRRVADETRIYVEENLALARHLGVFFPMMQVFTNLGLAIVIGFGGVWAILGTISTGDFVAFVSYLNLLAWPMMAMGWVTNLVQRGAAAMRRINRVLETAPDIVSPAEARPVPEPRGEISITNLSFAFPGAQKPLFDGLSLFVRAGESVALAGPVGCGKTTLLLLLPRLWDPGPGTVFLDGMDAREYPLPVLRGRMGFVTQETVIFSETMAENVAFGRKDVSEEKVEEALKAARLDAEASAMENGIHALLGERGITLSGGQRQRLALARALVRDAPVLILDDALSMVDARTEDAIVADLLAARKGKTTILVSHRTSTLRRVERVLVLDRGQIAETGPHADLMAANGLYRKLYERQMIAEALEGD